VWYVQVPRVVAATVLPAIHGAIYTEAIEPSTNSGTALSAAGIDAILRLSHAQALSAQ